MSVTEAVGEEEENQLSDSPSGVSEMTQPTQEEYSWPVIRFEVPPHRTYHFYHQFRTATNPNNFLKGVKWSPDGSRFLTSSEDNMLRTFTLPNYGSDGDVSNCYTASDEGADSYAANLVMNEGESVYDFCWYPYMSALDPVSCVFASTARDHPIHLWDVSSGKDMRAIFPIVAICGMPHLPCQDASKSTTLLGMTHANLFLQKKLFRRARATSQRSNK